MRTTALTELKKHLRPGRVYRREALAQFCPSVDRQLKKLTDEGTLHKLRNGLYFAPRKYEFGEAPAEERELVRAFLKTDRFVVASPNLYNQLGVGTTQLYDKRVVYNQKRHGTFPLGSGTMTFKRQLNVPKRLTQEFLLVNLVNELDELAEDREAVLARVSERAKEMDRGELLHAARLYGKTGTRKLFNNLLSATVSGHAA
jgi:hypothetical protein